MRREGEGGLRRPPWTSLFSSLRSLVSWSVEEEGGVGVGWVIGGGWLGHVEWHPHGEVQLL